MSNADLRMGSEQRLWELIEQRADPGADVDKIDSKIWELFGETWAVIFTDLAGFSRQVAKFGIIHFLQVIYESKRMLFPIISQQGGFLVKAEADSLLLVFRSPATALRCAIEMQHACQIASARKVAEEKVLLGLGIGYGSILRIGEHDVWGAEVNAASKLGEDAAQADDILVTASVKNEVGVIEGISYDNLDEVVPGSDENYRVVYKKAGN